jgi:hypothetical protein
MMLSRTEFSRRTNPRGECVSALAVTLNHHEAPELASTLRYELRRRHPQFTPQGGRGGVAAVRSTLAVLLSAVGD